MTLRLSVTGAVDDSTADWSVNLWAQQSNGDTTVDNATDWSDWSTELAALEKTMHLDGFVQAVRIQPDRYRVELPAHPAVSGIMTLRDPVLLLVLLLQAGVFVRCWFLARGDDSDALDGLWKQFRRDVIGRASRG